MKLGIKLTLVVLAALLSPLIIPGPDGKPIMTVDDWIPHDTIALVSSAFSRGANTVADVIDNAEGADGAVDNNTTGAGSQIYTWRDENGVLHFSDQPTDGSTALEVPADALAIPARHFVDGPTGVPVTGTESEAGGSWLLEDRTAGRVGDNHGNTAPKIEDLDGKLKAIAEGDLDELGDIAKHLPELLEQAKTAREQIRTE